MKTILELKENLAILRANAATWNEEYGAALGALNEQIRQITSDWETSNAELLKNRFEANQAATDAETELREAVIAHYVNTGKKTFDKDLSVRVTEKFVYSETDAFEWAKKHGLCLALDKKAFEKIASVQDLEFVARKGSASAVIAKNL